MKDNLLIVDGTRLGGDGWVYLAKQSPVSGVDLEFVSRHKTYRDAAKERNRLMGLIYVDELREVFALLGYLAELYCNQDLTTELPQGLQEALTELAETSRPKFVNLVAAARLGVVALNQTSRTLDEILADADDARRTEH